LPIPKVLVREGKIKLFIPDPSYYRNSKGFFDPTYAPVFYNPRMALCRDIAVVAVQCHRKKMGKSISICDPLTATGVRGLRYAAEVQGVERVLINDIDPRAVELAKENVKINGLENRVEVKNMDARTLLHIKASLNERFDIIDVDPFGSPVSFIESAIRALKKGGLICLTATDMPPLCGIYPIACLRKYGGLSIRTEFCHEVAVRMVIASLVKKAAENDFLAKVVFSHATDHYVRVYAIIEKSITKANKALENLGFIVYCPKCLYRECSRGLSAILHQKCPICGGKLAIGGPTWCGPLFNPDFVEEMIEVAESMELHSKKRALSILKTIREEVNAPPTYYVVDAIASKLKISSPPIRKVIDYLRDKGYFASRTHFHPKGVKTNAPLSVIYESIKAYQCK